MGRAHVARQLGRDLRASDAAAAAGGACMPVVAQAASETASESDGDELHAAHGRPFFKDILAGAVQRGGGGCQTHEIGRRGLQDSRSTAQ